MKIALINPPSTFLMDERVFPNIGLVRVATQLIKDGYDTEIIDLAGNHNDKIPIADVYGFSSTTSQFPQVYKLHEQIKEKHPNAHTVIGGPHASSLYYMKEKEIEDINIKDLEVFDTIFSGEGELNNVELMFKKGWQKAPLIKNIDDVLIPDRNLIDINSYNFSLNGHKTSSIQSQRGCPGKCTFCCGRDIEMYNKVRQHSPERVIEELDKLNKDFGYNSFMWYNDELNVGLNKLEELCSQLEQKPYKHRGFIRSDYVMKQPKQIKWLKNAGFIKLCAGVESGSDRVLKEIKKQTTSKINSEVRNMIKKNEIHYESFMMLGHPGETLNEIIETYEWIKDNKPDDFDLNIITPYPGSKMYDDAKSSTKFKDYNWEYSGVFFNKPRYSKEDSFYKGLDKQSFSNVRTNTVTNKTLKKLRNTIDSYLR